MNPKKTGQLKTAMKKKKKLIPKNKIKKHVTIQEPPAKSKSSSSKPSSSEPSASSSLLAHSTEDDDTNSVLVTETLQQLKKKLDAERDGQRITALLHERLRLQKLVASGDITKEQADAIIDTKVVEAKTSAALEKKTKQREEFDPYNVDQEGTFEVGQQPSGNALVEGKIR